MKHNNDRPARIPGGGVGGPLAGPPAAASYRLEPSDSNLNEPLPVDVVAVVPCKCRCRTCPKCGPKLGWRVRQNMLAKAGHFRNPAMLSLTVDRSHFPSPEDAHQAITQGSYIARLMRLLKIRTWFWVLEFQTKTGDGWPHWHLLIDLDDVAGRLDLAKAWRLWRDKWGLGGLDLSTRRSFTDQQHAVLYVTKYLTKMPEAFPIWVIVREKAIRFIGGCKAMGSLTGQPPRDVAGPEPVDQMNLPFREPRTILLIRMARCEMTANVFSLAGDCGTGEGEWRYMGTIPATVDDLVDLAEHGLVSLRMAAIEWGEKELVVITDASVGGIVAALRRARGQLADREVGYADEWARRAMDREDMILNQHAAYWSQRIPA